MFSEYGLGAVVLTMEPSRYEYCEGSERSDDLRQVLEAGPGLLTRQTMLRTPFVWIQVWRPPQYSHRSLIARLRRELKQVYRLSAELFRPRFSAECHRWLHEPMPAHREQLASNLLITHLSKLILVHFVVNKLF